MERPKPAQGSARLHLNPASRKRGFDPAPDAVLLPEAFAAAISEIATWPGYRATPLVRLCS